MTKNISIDTYDIIVCVAMIGGFLTGNWIPLWLFAGVYAWAAIITKTQISI